MHHDKEIISLIFGVGMCGVENGHPQMSYDIFERMNREYPDTCQYLYGLVASLIVLKKVDEARAKIMPEFDRGEYVHDFLYQLLFYCYEAEDDWDAIEKLLADWSNKGVLPRFTNSFDQFRGLLDVNKGMCA